MNPSPRILAASSRSGRRVLALASLLASLGCGGDTLVLGADMPRPYRFGAPTALDELSVEAKSDNPSLTADLLEIYFTAGNMPGPGGDIWLATRPSANAPFGAPTQLEAPIVPAIDVSLESSPIVSADGLALWFASDRPGGLGDLDIWFATRPARAEPWSAPENLRALNSADKEIPRPPGLRQRVMPLASDRGQPGFYRIYFAERAAITTPFQAPDPVEELSFAEQSTVDGFLTDDGLTLFYVTGPEIGPADLFVASRRATTEPFELSVPLSDLNTASDERDPWLSQDGSLFFFASDRSGRYEIYVAEAEREPVDIAAP
jgi:hypothetical protein